MREGRRCFGAAAIGDKMHVAGGVGAANSANIECYDPERDEWAEAAPLPRGLLCFAAVVCHRTNYADGKRARGPSGNAKKGRGWA